MSPVFSVPLNIHVVLICAHFSLQSYFLKVYDQNCNPSHRHNIRNLSNGINPTLSSWMILCSICPRWTSAIFFAASYWQVITLFASWKLLSKKLVNPSGRDCTSGKEKVQFNVLFRSSWLMLCKERTFMKTDSQEHHSQFVSLLLFPSQRNPFQSFLYSLCNSHASIFPLTLQNVFPRFKAFVFFFQ